MKDESKYPLADLIKALGDELREAQRRTQEEASPLLKLKECSVEMAVTWNKKADGGVEFWVVKLGGEISKENTQTLTVTMEPIGDADVDMTIAVAEVDEPIG